MINEKMHERAVQVMPGGVSSPVRAFGSVGGTPRIIQSAHGAHLQDVDGNRYIDLQMAFGPLILGHAHPAVVQAVTEAAHSGTAYGATSVAEIELAEEAVRRNPRMRWIRFVNSGTEALMSAVRLARAATRRSLLVKFEGGYHGHADAFLTQAGSGLATFDTSTSAGVPLNTAAQTVTLPLGDGGAIDAFFARNGDKVAAAVVEGVPANHGLMPQSTPWHRRLRKLTREHGALLVVDEVITGFRLAWGGATQLLGLEPDIITLGKILGGGVPVGAYGGRKDLMEQVSPLGPTYQAGTLSGSPLAMRAGLATLTALDETANTHARLATTTAELARRLEDLARSAGIPFTQRTAGSLLWFVLEQDFEAIDAKPVAPKTRAAFGRLHQELLREGLYLPPSAYEVCFLSTAHTPDVLDSAADCFERAFRRLRQ